jgi:hypothetical protein
MINMYVCMYDKLYVHTQYLPQGGKLYKKLRHWQNPDDDNDDDVYLKKITTRVSQNLILQKNVDQPKA